MINLLSPRAKKKLWNEYRLRLGVIALCAFLTIEFVTAVAFFPSFYILHATTGILSAELDQQKSRPPQKGEDSVKQLTALRGELDVLEHNSESNEKLPSELFGDMLNVKPKGISISALSYQKEKDTTSVQFSGMASTRDDILSFKSALSANPKYVVQTDDYLTKKTNINFSIRIIVKP